MFPNQREMRWDFQMYGFPAAMHDSLLSKLPEGVRAKTEEYLRQFHQLPPGVAPIYIGRAQAGKSRAAAVLALAFQRQNVGVEWVNCPSQMPEIERAKFADTTHNTIFRWKRIPVLILDDFLIAPASLIQELVWSREAEQLPTILTGNVHAEPGRELDEIATTWGAAGPGIVHRLKTLSGGFGLFTS